MRKFLVALVILAVVLVVLDRAGLFIAQREIGSRVQSAYGLPARPGVSVQGFPFLTQVASGNYQQIDVSIKSASAGGVQLENIDATFTGVHAPLSLLFGQSGNGVTADNATGTALIPFSQVQRRLPAGIRISPDGSSDLHVSGTGGYGTVRGTAKLGVSSSGITVRPQRLSIAGISAQSLASRLTFTIPVGELPLHLTVTAVHVTQDGLVVDAAGHNVKFASA
ncbi:MAG TPA: DUF2993 domain-containing protein [Streptosporangiaceae bacterium]|nr:DUF2993 domain-containing protein [Streptosporangiaceae bacterium]